MLLDTKQNKNGYQFILFQARYQQKQTTPLQQSENCFV